MRASGEEEYVTACIADRSEGFYRDIYIYINIYMGVSQIGLLCFIHKSVRGPGSSASTPATAATATGAPAAPKHSGPDGVGASTVVSTMSLKIVFDFL